MCVPSWDIFSPCVASFASMLSFSFTGYRSSDVTREVGTMGIRNPFCTLGDSRGVHLMRYGFSMPPPDFGCYSMLPPDFGCYSMPLPDFACWSSLVSWFI